MELLESIRQTHSIRRSAHLLGINSNTAKSIYYKFQKTGMFKKQSRTRKDYRNDYKLNRLAQGLAVDAFLDYANNLNNA